MHFLPHPPVIRINKNRPKYDVFMMLVPWLLVPVSTESLFGVLLRYRTYHYAFIPDIKMAFLQISLTIEHCDFVRFLWFEDMEMLIIFKLLNFSHIVCNHTGTHQKVFVHLISEQTVEIITC